MHDRLGADPAILDRVPDIALIADGLAVNGKDDVLVLQARKTGRAFRQHVDEDAAIGRQAERLADVFRHGPIADAEPGLLRDMEGSFAALDEIARDTAHRVDGNGEAETDAAAVRAGTENRGVDADKLAVLVGERAAGVAPVDGRVGLDRAVEDMVFVYLQVAPVQGRDDADRDRGTQAEWIADGDAPLADLQAIRIAEFGDRQAGGFDTHDGEIGLRIAPDQPRVVPTAIRQRDPDAVRAINDMVVRENVAVRGEDDAGAFAAHLLLYQPGRAGVVFGMHAPHRIYVDDRRFDAPHRRDDLVVPDRSDHRRLVEQAQRAPLRLRRRHRARDRSAQHHHADPDSHSEDE